MFKLTVFYQGNTKILTAREGETLLTVLQRAGIPVHAPCGGQGQCQKCLVKLNTEDGISRTVLACTTKVTRDCTVEVPELDGGVIASDGGRGTQPSHLAPRPGYGIAVDLGTTTVIVQLFSLAEGAKPLGTKSAWNAQSSYGADVISRAQYCMVHPEGRKTLSHVIREQVFSLAKQLCFANKAALPQLKEAVVAGNTIMQHLFAGLDPSSIAVAPYLPSTLFADGKAFYFPEFPHTAVTFSPCVAGYVGGDITAGLLSGRLMDEKGLCLFLDIGTNGEMALWDGTQFYCCSVASGPAFEGAQITCGMSSTPGAINHVTYTDEEFQIQVIAKEKSPKKSGYDFSGVKTEQLLYSEHSDEARDVCGTRPANTDAQGICGSGLIDLLAVLLDLEIVDESGWLLPPEEADEEFASYLSEDENGNGVFHLTPTVFFTAADVRKLQLAKAAVAAGIEILLKEAGRTAQDVTTLFLAGGFGDNLVPENAAKIGMIPSELTDRVFCLGNSSLDGARQLLLCPDNLERLKEIQGRCRYIELSGSAAFSDAFIDHMSFETED